MSNFNILCWNYINKKQGNKAQQRTIMEVAVEVSPNNYDSVSSASPDIPSEIQRENGDGDEGWPLPVVAARVDCPDGEFGVSQDAPLPSTSDDNRQPSATEGVQFTPQRKPLPVRTLSQYFCSCHLIYVIYLN